ncbi:MAG: aminopeptidase [Gaiellales bacterium]
MTDPRIARMADVVVRYSLDLKPGNLVLIQGPALAEPLIVELVRAALDADAVPRVRVSAEGVDYAFLSRAGDAQLRHVPPAATREMEAIDARISVHAAWNTRELSGIDPARLALRSETMRPIMQRFMERSAAGELAWNVTAYPCEAFAQDADMSLAAYEDFLFRAAWLHLEDPVAAWTAFAGTLTDLAAKLAGVRRLRVVTEDTDLTVGVAGRTWIPAKGDRNFPDGEVFTGPEETVTEGDVRFSYPAIFGGREVDDVRLRFQGGRVVKSEASAGDALLREMLSMDEGASVLGEFAIGTNYAVTEFTKQILFDEKIGGTCHMAVGAGYPETGSTNRSGLHWDMVCDLRSGGEIYADGELIYAGGKFVPEFAPDLSVPAG